MKYIKKKINGKSVDVHRFLVEQLIGRKLTRYEVVHHVDGNCRNNSIENLRIMSLSEHSRIHQRGVNANSCKLTEHNVIEIYKSIGSRKDIGAKFGVSRNTVNDIKWGKTWSHITNNV